MGRPKARSAAGKASSTEAGPEAGAAGSDGLEQRQSSRDDWFGAGWRPWCMGHAASGPCAHVHATSLPDAVAWCEAQHEAMGTASVAALWHTTSATAVTMMCVRSPCINERTRMP